MTEATVGGRSAQEARPAAPGPAETLEQKYMRQTRTAVVFIAVIVGVMCVLILVGAIAVEKVNTQLSNLSGTSTSSSNCLSQGGTELGC